MRAVAAEALLPVAMQLTSMHAASTAALSDQLWDILLDVDELSPSTGAAAGHMTVPCSGYDVLELDGDGCAMLCHCGILWTLLSAASTSADRPSRVSCGWHSPIFWR